MPLFFVNVKQGNVPSKSHAGPHKMLCCANGTGEQSCSNRRSIPRNDVVRIQCASLCWEHIFRAFLCDFYDIILQQQHQVAHTVTDHLRKGRCLRVCASVCVWKSNLNDFRFVIGAMRQANASSLCYMKGWFNKRLFQYSMLRLCHLYMKNSDGQVAA